MIKLYRKSNHLILAIDESDPNAYEQAIRLRALMAGFGPWIPYVTMLDDLIDRWQREGDEKDATLLPE
jgi:hypothetical protein